MVRQFVVTAQGKEELAELVPVSEKQTITNWLQETEDGLKVQRLRGGILYLNLKISVPYETDRDRSRLEWSGACTSFRVLSTTSELNRFIDDLSDSEIEFARLYMWADQLVTIPVLSRRLKEAIDEDGRVTDDASPELKSIRQNIRRSEQAVREQLDGIVRGKMQSI